MKLKTKLIIAFLTVLLLPIILGTTLIFLLGAYQISTIEKTYKISGSTVESLSNSMQTISSLTEESYHELVDMAAESPARMEDATALGEFNRLLQEKNAYLLVRKGYTMIYVGTDMENADSVIAELPDYGGAETTSENGIYLGGDAQSLVKQVDFEYPDGDKGSAFIVSDVRKMIPELEELMVDIVVCIVFILILTACALTYWVYRSVMQPLQKMQLAAKNIKDQDLEDMRVRLRDNVEEKLRYDRESKELISNISHDLKTPVTAIKGYAEGIMDGVADTPEKMQKYVRTIYNKADEMNTLINELTFYSKIDTNRIPYNFNTLSVNDYFEDCAEDLSLELEAKNVEFGYFNYVEKDVKVIADAEQIKRVIHNIVNNSLKYMDKPKPKINLRVKDVGDFVQIELEDNGKGIAAKDLPNIFDRFYRTDASRNSSKGGSGIGLSIVKKIIEEHGGKIWATSREETGTTMYFVLRKYQEVPIYE